MVIKKYTEEFVKNKINSDGATFISCSSNIKRETKIVYNCKCGNEFKKGVRMIVENGAYCKTCMSKIATDKTKKTNLKNHGCVTNLNTTEALKKKANEKKKEAYEKERHNIKKCLTCDGDIISSSKKSKKCRKCFINENNKKRKEKKSNNIHECVTHLFTKNKDLQGDDKNELLKMFDSQSRCCYHCDCKLKCPILNSNKNIEKYELNYDIPSLDRIDNSNEKHTIDNVVISCWMCNIMRGESTIDEFKKTISILKGNCDTIDFSDLNPIEKLTDNKYTIEYERVRNFITPENIKQLRCKISEFPIYVTKDRCLYGPSWDRKINKDEFGNKKGHDKDDDLSLVCWFINKGRNSINTIDSYIDIFNKKFPNRCRDIKVKYPDNYEYINLSNNRFWRKDYYESKISTEINNKSTNTKKKTIINRTIKKVLIHNNNIKRIRQFCIDNKRQPDYKKESEKELYKKLLKLKQFTIFEKQLKEIPYINLYTIDGEWNKMCEKLIDFINENNSLPKTGDGRKLYNWVSTQRRHYKKLSEDKIKKLEEIQLWWWTEIHMGYKRHSDWFEKNPNKKPTKKHGVSLYIWYKKITKMIEQNKLDKEYDIELISTIAIFS